MATYPLEKILADYESGKMDVEMTLGHSLQHIGQLHASQSAANADRQALHKQVNTIEHALRSLQDELGALKRLVAGTKTPSHPKGQEIAPTSGEKPATDR